MSSVNEFPWPRGARIIAAWLRCTAWMLFAEGCGGLLFIGIIAEGARLTIPPLGQRLYRLPGLAGLKNYQATYQLDLAPFFAGLVLVGVWYLWGRILKAWIAADGCEGWWKATPHMQFITSVGGAILLFDALLFFRAMTQYAWGGSVFSFSALIATGMYVALMVFIAFVAANLQLALKKRTEE